MGAKQSCGNNLSPTSTTTSKSHRLPKVRDQLTIFPNSTHSNIVNNVPINISYDFYSWMFKPKYIDILTIIWAFITNCYFYNLSRPSTLLNSYSNYSTFDLMNLNLLGLDYPHVSNILTPIEWSIRITSAANYTLHGTTYWIPSIRSPTIIVSVQFGIKTQVAHVPL